MKVFISWSGDRSKEIALALRKWLPRCIQTIKPYMSNKDIEKGARGVAEIFEQLSDSNFGIVCLTPENLDGKWIHFEAGALSKHIKSRVCTLLFHLTKSQIEGPLAEFQHTVCNKSDIECLLETINKNLNEPLSDDLFKKQFDTYWPELEEELNKIPEPETKVPDREPVKILEEILERVRQIPSNVERAVRTKEPKVVLANTYPFSAEYKDHQKEIWNRLANIAGVESTFSSNMSTSGMPDVDMPNTSSSKRTEDQ